MFVNKTIQRRKVSVCFISLFLLFSSYTSAGIDPERLGLWYLTNESSDAFLFDLRENYAVFISYDHYYRDLAVENFTFNYKEIDENKVIFTSAESETEAEFSTDEQVEILKVESVLPGWPETIFKKRPVFSINDLDGIWYSKVHDTSEDRNEETIYIETWHGLTYDFERIELNHVEKTFSRYKVADLPFQLSSDLTFTEMGDDEKYGTEDDFIFFIIEKSDSAVTFMDIGGSRWSINRLEDFREVTIPEGYVETE